MQQIFTQLVDRVCCPPDHPVLSRCPPNKLLQQKVWTISQGLFTDTPSKAEWSRKVLWEATSHIARSNKHWKRKQYQPNGEGALTHCSQNYTTDCKIDNRLRGFQNILKALERGLQMHYWFFYFSTPLRKDDVPQMGIARYQVLCIKPQWWIVTTPPTPTQHWLAIPSKKDSSSTEPHLRGRTMKPQQSSGTWKIRTKILISSGV